MSTETLPATDGGDAAGGEAAAFDLDAGWRLHPQVAVRPERFGALLYHFGTRRLSFVKTPTLLAVLQALAGAGSARDACAAAGVAVGQLPHYRRALAALAQSNMICEEDVGGVPSGSGAVCSRSGLVAAGATGDGQVGG